ncbi:MAG: multiprotein bridging factor aMBF1 [Candidatus Odinarchaeota archaeon]
MSEEYCEMCGKKAYLKQYEIDGAIVEACPQCGRYGKPVVQTPIKTPHQPRWRSNTESTEMQERSRPIRSKQVTSKSRPKRYGAGSGEEMLVDNYGSLIIKARMKAGLERKDLAMQIKETESLIFRIEQEKIRPDDTVVRKLEKFLKIKLRTTEMGALSTAEFLEKPSAKGMTLGDVVHIKKKKQK